MWTLGAAAKSCGEARTAKEKEGGETAWIQDGARWGGFGVAMLSDDVSALQGKARWHFWEWNKRDYVG